MKLRSSIVVFVLLSVSQLRAGSVINTNLPAGTTLVNIDGTADGAASYSGPGQEYWYQPFNGVQVNFQPGTYQFRFVDPADATALYPNLTTGQLNQIYTGWTFNSPWSENYFAFDISAKTNSSETQLFDGALDPAFDVYGSAQAAYDATVANGYYDKIRPAPPGRTTDPTAYITSWTFAAPESVLFVVPDAYLGDITGGVSVAITSIASRGDMNFDGHVNAKDIAAMMKAQLRPDYASSHFDLGTALAQLGQNQAAIAKYNTAIQLQPNYPDAHHNLAFLLAAAGQTDEAIEHYREALRRRPNFPEAHFNWANTIAHDHPQEAIEHYQAAIQLQPDYAEAFANLAATYAQIGDRTRAIAAVQKAVELAQAQHNEPLARQLEPLLRSYQAP